MTHTGTRCNFGETLWHDIDDAIANAQRSENGIPTASGWASIYRALRNYFGHKRGKDGLPPCPDCERLRMGRKA